MIKLSQKSKFLLDKFKRSIALARRGKAPVTSINLLEEEVNKFLEPKRSKFFKADRFNQKKKFKKKLKIKKGTDPLIVARKLNGAKGGNKTAALYSKKQRAEWGSKAGTSTLNKYGRGFFSHIRKNRTKYPKHKRKS